MDKYIFTSVFILKYYMNFFKLYTPEMSKQIEFLLNILNIFIIYF